METFFVVILVAGGLLLTLDLSSEVIRRLWLTVPLLAMTAGILLGPSVLGVVEPERLGEPKAILAALAGVTLTLSVLDLGHRFEPETLRATYRTGSRLLFLGMLGMWTAASLGAWLLLDVPFWVAVLVGAILTPTDPVVAAALTSEGIARANLPRRLRRLLQFEAGANDGLTIVLFLLPVVVLTHRDGDVLTWLGQAARAIGIGVGFGVVLGVVGGWLVNRAIENKDARQPLLVGGSVGASLIAFAGANLLHGSGVLAAFITGLLFAVTADPHVRERVQGLQEVVANLFVPPVFALFGAMLPWAAWSDLGVLGLVFAVWVLLVRRPPAITLAVAGTDEPLRDRAFLAWFGPIGVAAMFYVAELHRYPAVPEQETIFAAVSLAVALSILAHGVSATPLVRRYGGRSATETLRHPLTPQREE